MHIKYEYNIRILHFEGMTEKTAKIMEKHVDILMGATGTGLLFYLWAKQFAIDDQDQPEQEK